MMELNILAIVIINIRLHEEFKYIKYNMNYIYHKNFILYKHHCTV